MTNEFIPIPGYNSRYSINTSGEVKVMPRTFKDSINRSIKIKEKFLKTWIDKLTGYPVVKLTRPDGSYGTKFIHRLVALTFIPNPENKCCVNHINGNKLDYSLYNLEWATMSENQLHAIRMNLAKIPSENRTPVINMCNGKRYNSIKQAALDNNIEYDRCKRILSGRLTNDTCLQRAA